MRQLGTFRLPSGAGRVKDHSHVFRLPLDHPSVRHHGRKGLLQLPRGPPKPPPPRRAPPPPRHAPPHPPPGPPHPPPRPPPPRPSRPRRRTLRTRRSTAH